MVAINQSGIVKTMVESQFVIAEPGGVTLAQVRQVLVVSHRHKKAGSHWLNLGAS